MSLTSSFLPSTMGTRCLHQDGFGASASSLSPVGACTHTRPLATWGSWRFWNEHQGRGRPQDKQAHREAAVLQARTRAVGRAVASGQRATQRGPQPKLNGSSVGRQAGDSDGGWVGVSCTRKTGCFREQGFHCRAPCGSSRGPCDTGW